MSKIEIAVSYSRKVNHSLYGGMDFESSDFFCSVKKEVDEALASKTAGELQLQAKGFVDKAVVDEITGLSGGLPKKAFNMALDQYLTKGTMRAEDYEVMSPFQQQIIQAIKRSKARTKNK